MDLTEYQDTEHLGPIDESGLPTCRAHRPALGREPDGRCSSCVVVPCVHAPTPKSAIAYRSPLGRVAAYDQFGAVVERHEPGGEADAAWERLRVEGARVYDGAEWMDPRAEAKTETKTGETMNEYQRFLEEKTHHG
jgi:hypothetical protein